ncbi:MAG: Aldo-keto reductase IolS [Candidatus Moanabacter tarae]|uniref:Aldo-keto reductase IolS n=1 Tax=Candidatus Moanibacter tarae TaxID=2200854 RepID=A0A2Z4ABQ7_9BACT|nr:MAG: Aldo-keto reductase IolS [Candidatus Moanabacter tarae]|tara:strand:+ start:3545 stop:4507 length:963 start_codon:yes stop_codon:yes gene_type:complete
MEYTSLGRTELKVSVAGLGCGGFSRIGKGTGKSDADSISIIRKALDLGVTFIDTAAVYGTESLVGRAIKGYERDELVLSTKALVNKENGLQSPEQLTLSLEHSLQSLGVDYVEVFHLHGVRPKEYDYVCETVLPFLIRQQEKGKFKFLGITESPPEDSGHRTLARAVKTEFFPVIMVAFHMLHQSARKLIFPITREKNIGVLCMFAVRLLFSESGRLKRVVRTLVEKGQLPMEFNQDAEPLDFLIHEAGALSIIDAAYRYCRHSNGPDVVLFGTGNLDHLKANIDSLLRPALPESDVAKLETLFGALTNIGLDAPGKGQR